MNTHYAHFLCKTGTYVGEGGFTYSSYTGILPYHEKVGFTTVSPQPSDLSHDIFVNPEPSLIVVYMEGTEAELDAAAADPDIVEIYRNVLEAPISGPF